MSQRTAVLGGGVMGGTLVSAIVSAGASDVVVIEANSDRAAELAQEYGVQVGAELDLIVGADTLLLAVKPQDIGGLLPAIAERITNETVVVSIAAGITTATLEADLPASTPVLRVMPNTPAVIGEGMFGVSAGTHVSDAHLAKVVEMLEHGGKVVVIDESLQNALTAVSGSGPAYLFYLAEHMIEAGVAEGLERDVARLLTEQTLFGSAALLAQSPQEPAELRRRVTSPNGTTYAATSTFDQLGVGTGIFQGIRAAVARAAELG